MKITLEDGQALPCDVALMSVGRAPRVDGLNLEALKLHKMNVVLFLLMKITEHLIPMFMQWEM